MVTPDLSPYDPSPAVLRILTKTYRNDWVTDTAPGKWGRWEITWPAPDQMARAVAAGIMFTEPRVLDHDDWVAAARDAAAALSAQDIGDAFLASLTSRRLDLRSALGSYAIARVLPPHPYSTWREMGCAVSGMQVRKRDGTLVTENLNDFSVARFRPGAYLRDVKFAAFDLEQFARAPRLAPTSADTDLGRQIIAHLRQLPPETTAAQASAGLTMIRGNKNEREALVDILGVCGILHAPDYPGYAHDFIPATRAIAWPNQRYAFGHYPTWWWRASGGIDDPALRQFLPRLS